MKSKKTLFFVVFAIIIIPFHSVFSESKRILARAEITNIDESTITVSSRKKTYLIDASSATFFDFAMNKTNISKYFVGDRIDVWGTLGSTRISAKKIRNRSLRAKALSRKSIGAEDLKDDVISSLDLISSNLITGDKIKDYSISGNDLTSNINIATTGRVSAASYNGNFFTTGTGTLTLNNHTLSLSDNASLNQNLLTTSHPTFGYLNISSTPSEPGSDFMFGGKSWSGAGMAIPYLRPVRSNTALAFDLIPNGSPVEEAGNGFVWSDYCSADILSGSTDPVVCTRVGIRSDAVEFGTRKWYGASDLPIYFTMDGSTKMSIFPSGKIGVGLGSTAPNFKLQIGDTSNAAIQLSNDTSGYGTSDGFVLNSSTDRVYFWNYENSPLTFGANNAEVMRIAENGNLGIGTTRPGYKVDIQGGYLNASSGICINGSCQTTWQNVSMPASTNGQTLYSNADVWTSTANLYNNGTNVGIGTTEPLTVFQVGEGQDVPSHGTSSTWTGYFTRNGQTDVVIRDASNNVEGDIRSTTAGFLLGSNTNHPLGLFTNYAMRMQISNSGGFSFGNNFYNYDPGTSNMIIEGNVGIGTTSPQSSLQIGGYVQLQNNSGAPPAYDCDASSEEGRLYWDAGSDEFYICSGASGWRKVTTSAP